MEAKIIKKQNVFLDFWKGVACISIILIHFPLPGEFGNTVRYLAEFAVPLFFLISGYYSYDQAGRAKEKIARRIKRIQRLTLFSCVFYFIYTVLLNIKRHELAEYWIEWTSLRKWISIFALGDLDILGAGHLWFIVALLYSYYILLFLEKRDWMEKAYKWIQALFILKLVVVIWVESTVSSWHWKGNVLIGALPYILLGHYIAKRKSILRSGTIRC